MLEVLSLFKGLRAGSQVLALLIFFFFVIMHTMWSGNMMCVKIMLAVCMLV